MRRFVVVGAVLLACSSPPANKPEIKPAPPVVLETRELAVTSDVKLAAFVRGPDSARDTVIVVNGGPGLSHDYIAPVDQLASPTRRVAFYDQRGTGRSARPPVEPEQHTLARHVADLEAVRAALGAERVHLIGHSWGSMIVQRYAIEHSAHVASLVFLGPIPATHTSFGAGVAAFGARAKALAEQGLVPAKPPAPAGDGDCSRLKAMTPVYYADPRTTPGAALAKTTCHDLWGATMSTLGEFDHRSALSRLQLPALVGMGDADPFGIGWAEELAAAIPKARKVIFPSCGHLPWDECAAPFFRALGEFLPP